METFWGLSQTAWTGVTALLTGGLLVPPPAHRLAWMRAFDAFNRCEQFVPACEHHG